MLPSVLFALCSDGLSQSLTISPAHQALQRTSLNLLFGDFAGNPIHFTTANFIREQATDPEDICQWRGIECTRGEMTALVCFKKLLGDNAVIDLRWLPGTLQYVHLTHLTAERPWSASQLPRDLRYFFARNVFLKQLPASETLKFAHSMEMHRLPRRMEEFILTEGFWAGPIQLVDLPQSLRLLCIIGLIRDPVYVASETLPKDLKRIKIRYERGGKPPKVVALDDFPIDSRISVRPVGAVAANPHGNDSQYYAYYADMGTVFHKELRRQSMRAEGVESSV